MFRQCMRGLSQLHERYQMSMFCTSGLQILSGAKTIDLEWVQVHPTGLVKPDDADAKIKFLAAEALRGVGGLILNKDGVRFANELGRRPPALAPARPP